MAAKMMKQTKINIASKCDTHSLFCETKEFLTEIFADDKRKILPEGQGYIWEEEKPEILKRLERQLMATVKLKSNVKKTIFRLYTPPEKVAGRFKSKTTTVSEKRPDVYYRFVVSTTREILNMSAMNSDSDKKLMMPWTAVQLPILISGQLQLFFENTYSEKMPMRNGHRPTNIKKNPEERYVLVFDIVGDLESMTSEVVEGLQGSSMSQKEKAEMKAAAELL